MTDSKNSIVLFDFKNVKVTKLEKPEIITPGEQIIILDCFSYGVLAHTNKQNLYVYCFKDHDWQTMTGAQNYLILKNEKLMVTYDGRYEVYNKNFLLIF